MNLAPSKDMQELTQNFHMQRPVSKDFLFVRTTYHNPWGGNSMFSGQDIPRVGHVRMLH